MPVLFLLALLLAPADPPVPSSRVICTVQEARRIDLAELGAPEGSRPVDLVLGRSTVWILFEPSLLMGIPRVVQPKAPVAYAEFGEVEEVEMIPGPRPDAWRSLAIDPREGTLWLASPSGLWRKRPGRRPELLKGAPAGGFRDAVADRGAVWAVPACPERAVWRLDASGKRLGIALGALEALEAGGEECPALDLERDWSGTVWALKPATGEVFRLGFDGRWGPAELPVPAPAPAGSNPVRSWFFWGEEPMALGEGDGALYRRADGRVSGFREDCGEGNGLVRVAGDAQGWAALTRSWLLLGEHRRPDPGSQ